MMQAVLLIAKMFGISPLRIIVYAAAVMAVVTAAVVIRHHYVSLGYTKALADVKKQDSRAVEAANAVEQKTAACTQGVNGYWDVLTQSCKLDDAQ
jgi:hypothetical protein